MPIEVAVPKPNQPQNSVVDVNKIKETMTPTINDVNKVVNQMYGIDVAYFRAIPHPTGEDVIFQNYTLYDVESCPTSVKLLFLTSLPYLAYKYRTSLP